ncbi:5'-nucleotidase domain containing 1 [Ictidomys tridecemlineatus]|uniref:5'-nucleotidase domain-containing protein 1 n=1 Tax=Ictidomys tridecemlineatus TaxID=43179 RepID=UPI000B540CB6|nr:5'-nucleotidase domain-containing protein 1 [Ictidomys tridecemlineatus]KAG3290096.1 5'-nucleotidase domain containing 1 [Ictidomys tridecemlineatus]
MGPHSWVSEERLRIIKAVAKADFDLPEKIPRKITERKDPSSDLWNLLLEDPSQRLIGGQLYRAWESTVMKRENSGLYFPEIKRDPGKYLHSCPESVRKWLRQLKNAGKILLLITSSHSDYCRLLCEYILGNDFEDLFDIVITNALKPGFFSHSPSQRPFRTLKNDEEQEVLPSLNKPGWYSQGNAVHLYELLKKMTGKPEPKVVYFGDSMHSDVFPARHYRNWETVLILEELQGEEAWKPEESEPLEKRGKYEVPKTKLLNTFSKKWGSFFIDSVSQRENSEDSLVYTWSSKRINTYSTIAIPSIEAIAELPLDYKFTRFSSNSSKTAGYYPLVNYTNGLIE